MATFELKNGKTCIVSEGFWYDDDLYIEAGEYESCEHGINGWPMILVNGEWIDIVIE